MEIVANDISKSFGEKRVLESFSYTFRDGSFTAVMGPSGCGKSTLLAILMGTLPADSGEIVPSGSFRRSAVFQENRLCENLTAGGNIRLVTGKKYSADDIAAELAALGLDGCENKPVKELSGGMKRRVALLRALLADYDVLFLDEPFKGLDDATKDLVIDRVRIKTSGRTVIMVTHDITECEKLAQNIIRLKTL